MFFERLHVLFSRRFSSAFAVAEYPAFRSGGHAFGPCGWVFERSRAHPIHDSTITEIFMKYLTSDSVQVGFIGMGNMGSRIAQRLLDHGYRLSVYDRNPVKTESIAT